MGEPAPHNCLAPTFKTTDGSIPREPQCKLPVTQPANRICILLQMQSPIRIPSTYTLSNEGRKGGAQHCEPCTFIRRHGFKKIIYVQRVLPGIPPPLKIYENSRFLSTFWYKKARLPSLGNFDLKTVGFINFWTGLVGEQPARNCALRRNNIRVKNTSITKLPMLNAKCSALCRYHHVKKTKLEPSTVHFRTNRYS